jgi:diketogulonate reductase-like aldo/keto reductase
MLARPQVSAVIVGARNRDHLASNLRISNVQLGAQDLAEIETVLGEFKPLAGDVYTLERDKTGRHGSIMKYNLNSGVKS